MSTTVDADLLSEARRLTSPVNDSSLLETALHELIAVHQRRQIAESYQTYEQLPLSTPDAWGDLESFLNASGR